MKAVSLIDKAILRLTAIVLVSSKRAQAFASIATKVANAKFIIQPGDPDAAIGLELYDALTCRGTPADDLVSRNNRLLQVFQIPVENMQIRAADAAGGDLDQTSPGLDSGCRQVASRNNPSPGPAKIIRGYSDMLAS